MNRAKDQGSMSAFATKGSQRWLQIAINRKPELVLSAMRRGGAITANERITWKSPLELYRLCEYRGAEALQKLGIKETKRTFKSLAIARSGLGRAWNNLKWSADIRRSKGAYRGGRFYRYESFSDFARFDRQKPVERADSLHRVLQQSLE